MFKPRVLVKGWNWEQTRGVYRNSYWSLQIQTSDTLYFQLSTATDRSERDMNLGICMNALSEIQAAQTDILCRGTQIQPSSTMASVESNQGEYKATHRLPEAHPHQKILREELGAPRQHEGRGQLMN